jgi:pimeloyl-ACP methyl ester carboxylesterase
MKHKSSNREKEIILLIGCAIAFLLLLFKDSFSQPREQFTLLTKESVEIQGKKYILQNAQIQVPEDRAKPDSRILTLPVRIFKTANANPAEPVFWLDGGPGASNMLSAEKLSAAVAASELLINHDIVCVGYRGADGSMILNSKKVNKAFKGLHHQLLSDQSLDNIQRKMHAYLTELKQKGIDLHKYTMLDVIDDLEYARQALGYQSVNLLSVSYGTRVALLYSYRYPEALNRTVMIGPNPPGHFIWQAKKTDEILDLYDSLYKAQNRSDYKGSIKEAMTKAFQKMPTRWSVYRLDADKIKVGTFAAMFSKEFAAMAFDYYFKAAHKGDYSGLYLIQLLVDMGQPIIGDLYVKAVSADFQADVDYRKTFRASHTVLGGNASLLYWGIAGNWPHNLIPEEYRTCRVTPLPTLVISGHLDVSTPADFATKELMPFLSNGQHVSLANMSHSDIFRKAMRTPDFLSSYYNSGDVKAALVETNNELNFVSEKKFSKLKIFIAGLIL